MTASKILIIESRENIKNKFSAKDVLGKDIKFVDSLVNLMADPNYKNYVDGSYNAILFDPVLEDPAALDTFVNSLTIDDNDKFIIILYSNNKKRNDEVRQHMFNKNFLAIIIPKAYDLLTLADLDQIVPDPVVKP